MGSSLQESARATEPSREVKRYSGRVVYLYAYDVAYEMKRLPVHELLGQPMAQFSVDASKRSPRHLFFSVPK